MVPSDSEVLAELDLGEPPQELVHWAKEHLNEDPETRCQVLQELRDMIYGKVVSVELFFCGEILIFIIQALVCSCRKR